MILTQEQQAELLVVARPLMKWLCDNTHPMCTVIVEQTRVEVLESSALMITEEFVKD